MYVYVHAVLHSQTAWASQERVWLYVRLMYVCVHKITLLCVCMRQCIQMCTLSHDCCAVILMNSASACTAKMLGFIFMLLKVYNAMNVLTGIFCSSPICRVHWTTFLASSLIACGDRYVIHCTGQGARSGDVDMVCCCFL